MAAKNVNNLNLKLAGSARAEPGATPKRSLDLADDLLALAFRVARRSVHWFLEPMMGEDGKVNWQALLWGNGKPRW